jgi:hypothetical protein
MHKRTSKSDLRERLSSADKRRRPHRPTFEAITDIIGSHDVRLGTDV